MLFIRQLIFAVFVLVLLSDCINQQQSSGLSGLQAAGAKNPGSATQNPQTLQEKQVPEITTFSSNEGAVCSDNNKPVIRLYSTTWCPHCKWIKETFDSVVKEYVGAGKITAYHWELDTGDNTLTEEVETEVPQSELDLYKEFNPKGSIPSFVFGCKYYRIGTGFESSQDLKAEEKEFRAVIENLLAENQ